MIEGCPTHNKKCDDRYVPFAVTDALFALTLSKVYKSYSDVRALQGLDMCVAEGDVYGFLGRNGAGKSTAMQVIMGITRADQGVVTLFDEPVLGDNPLLRQHLGYVAQEQHFYDWMSPARLGAFVGGFYPTWDSAEFKRLLKLLEVPLERKVGGFSGGMRAKLALALSLAHRPRLLLLDEPTAGMDAVARREFIDIVRDQAVRAQRTTIFSSHLIDEVEQAADKVGIVEAGTMHFEGSIDLLRTSVTRYDIQSADALDQPLPEAITVGRVVLQDFIRHGRRTVIVRTDPGLPSADVPWPWRPMTLSLEDIFISMVSKQVSKQLGKQLGT